jgi:hypothetical protein
MQKKLKTIALHVALVIVAWLIGGGTFGFIPMVMVEKDHNWDQLQRLTLGFEVFGNWVIYRIGAHLLRFPPPGEGMALLIRMAWCFFTYVLVGGSVEVAIGHPSIAAGLSGIPLGIVLFLLLARHDASAKTVTAK